MLDLAGRTLSGARPGLFVLAALLLAPDLGEAQAGASVDDSVEGNRIAGTWNLEMESLAQRPTRGVRNVLIRVTDERGELRAEITSLRNEFVPVSQFTYDPDAGTMHVRYGAYDYVLTLDGDSVAGSMTSPAGSQQVAGARQPDGDNRFTGVEAEPFEATRPGVIGHIESGPPPDGVEDPGEWVRQRITAPEDWALLVRQGALAIGFTNAEEFEAVLTEHAGTTVTLRGVWVGERVEIVELIPE